MKRIGDMRELLDWVSAELSKLHLVYEHAKKDETKASIPQPLVKSCLEHLRSVLEYAAQDTHDTVIGGKRRLYFPYGDNKKNFVGSVAGNLPMLPTLRPDVYALYESVQPHASGSTWLLDLCKHTNFNKHNQLSKAERVNSPNSTTKAGNFFETSGNASITFVGSTYNGQPIGGPRGEAVITGNMSAREVKEALALDIPVTREFEWVQFRFKGSSLDSLELLTKGHREITAFIDKLEKLLAPRS